MTSVSPRRFTALVRWRAAWGPAFEVETHHVGFRSAEAAALAANGLGGEGFDELLVVDGAVTIRRDGVPAKNARCAAVFVWASTSLAFEGMALDWSFERLDGGIDRVARHGRPERFAPYTFRVIDEATREDLAVEFVMMSGRIAAVMVRPVASRNRPPLFLS